MTLFDLSELFGPEPAPARPDTDAEPPRTDEHTDADRQPSAPAAVETLPEVEVRISARRKKTSEAKWVGGRIVVSLPAHLDVESRQKTIDWLVDRLLTRHRLDGPRR